MDGHFFGHCQPILDTSAVVYSAHLAPPGCEDLVRVVLEPTLIPLQGKDQIPRLVHYSAFGVALHPHFTKQCIRSAHFQVLLVVGTAIAGVNHTEGLRCMNLSIQRAQNECLGRFTCTATAVVILHTFGNHDGFFILVPDLILTSFTRVYQNFSKVEERLCTWRAHTIGMWYVIMW